MVHVTMYVT